MPDIGKQANNKHQRSRYIKIFEKVMERIMIKSEQKSTVFHERDSKKTSNDIDK